MKIMCLPTKGLNEDLVREISWMKGEPNWMRDFRVKSLKQFEKKANASLGWRYV